MYLFYLSSGFFLGWMLGANDGGNIFGTAISTRMIKFKLTAIIASIFVVIGAIVQGSGATQTISTLGGVNMMPGSFAVALATAITFYLMLRFRMPVSSTQAVIGAIIGWNMFSGYLTDPTTFTHILFAWIFTPILSGSLAILFYYLYKTYYYKMSFSLFKQDYINRIGFIILIAFAAFSLGANNVASVIGMFAHATPFTPISISNSFTITTQMQLLFFGGVSVAIGILTRSKANVKIFGNEIYRLSPVTGFIAILSSSIVLFVFSWKGLQIFLYNTFLPTLPLVPVSSAQAIVGAILGIGLVKGVNQIQIKKITKISLGWFISPIIAGFICFISLFIIQNVFDQRVYAPTNHIFNEHVIEKLTDKGFDDELFLRFSDTFFNSSPSLRNELRNIRRFSFTEQIYILNASEYFPMYVDPRSLNTIKNRNYFSYDIFKPLQEIEHEIFDHKWQLVNRLSQLSELWRYNSRKPQYDFNNSELQKRYNLLFRYFKDEE
jgi:PiT family inorganic phosphate transporter